MNKNILCKTIGLLNSNQKVLFSSIEEQNQFNFQHWSKQSFIRLNLKWYSLWMKPHFEIISIFAQKVPMSERDISHEGEGNGFRLPCKIPGWANLFIYSSEPWLLDTKRPIHPWLENFPPPKLNHPFNVL